MRERARGVVIALPVVLTLVIAGVVGGLVVLQDQRQADEVAEAEAVGQAYLAEVERFRSSVVKRVADADQSDPGRLSKVVDRAIAKPPRLGGAPSYGREHSSSYAEAERTRRTVLRPFKRLSSTLRRADMARDFIVAGRKVVTLRATEIVGSRFITSSAPVRERLIPAFVRARDEFVQVPVPKGQEALAATVRDAAQYVIDQATLLADRVDDGQPFTLTYAERFQAAADALDDYATDVEGDVSEAVAAASAPS